MPMIAEAAFAMLACARIGAIHSVVFGGFAAGSLATRIDDAKPVLMVSADAGMRSNGPVPYKHLVDRSLLAGRVPAQEGADRQPRARQGFTTVDGRDVDYATLRAKHMDARCRSPGSSRPSRATSCTSGYDRQTEGCAARYRWLRSGAHGFDEAHLHR